MRRKVLMLASTASKGPKVPFRGDYTLEVEGGELTDFAVKDDEGYLQVLRLQGDAPITVYANCVED